MVEPSGHIPVLFREVQAWLQPRSGGLYVDAALGDGGHARGIRNASHLEGCVPGLDADPGIVPFANKVLDFLGNRVLTRTAHCLESRRRRAAGLRGMAIQLSVRSSLSAVGSGPGGVKKP